MLAPNLDLTSGDIDVGLRLVINTSRLRYTKHSPQHYWRNSLQNVWQTSYDFIDYMARLNTTVLPDVCDQEKGGSLLWSLEHMDRRGSDQSIIIRRDAAEWMFVLFAGILITTFPWA